MLKSASKHQVGKVVKNYRYCTNKQNLEQCWKEGDSTFPGFVKTFESRREACSTTRICKIADYRNFSMQILDILYRTFFGGSTRSLLMLLMQFIMQMSIQNFFTYKEGWGYWLVLVVGWMVSLIDQVTRLSVTPWDWSSDIFNIKEQRTNTLNRC
jgi:hypothetical protein